jgi:hypothetical protein
MANVWAGMRTIKASLAFAIAAARVCWDSTLILWVFELSTEAEILGKGFSVLVLALRARPIIALFLFIVLIEVKNPLLDTS